MPNIVHRIAVAGIEPDVVHEAVATREGVTSWWIPTGSGGDQVGQTMTFGDLMAMKVLEVEPSRRVRWEVVGGPEDWLGTTITFDIKVEGQHTVILFTHRGWATESEHMHHCSTKWAAFLLSLKDYLETGTGRPGGQVLPTDNW